MPSEIILMKSFTARLHKWRIKNIQNQQFVLLLSLIIGILSGLAAIILKNTVYYTHYFLTNDFDFQEDNILYLALPLIGIILTVLYIRFFVKDDIGHGISKILYSISKRSALIRPHNNYSSMAASTITVGFGGSVGLEAPIVLTGSAIGSSIGRFMRMNYRTRMLLIGCGAAGAIAGIFKAPIAGIVFVIEVLMLDLTLATLLPLLISAVTASVVAFFLMGKGVLFSFELLHPFQLGNLPYYLILGVMSGLVSLYFTRMTMYAENQMKRIKGTYLKAISGGVILGVLIFVFPSLFGEGYEALKDILAGHGEEIVNKSIFSGIGNSELFFLVVLLLIMGFKAVATAVTTGAGGVGGIFAPSLFMGGLTGLFTARLINFFAGPKVTESHFALVGMAGVMAGVMHAPLTGIFLIAEITGGYQLFTPLMITATIAYLTIHYFEPHSIYTKRLAARGELLTHDKDKAMLTLLKVNQLIEKNFVCVKANDSLGDFVKAVAKSKRNIFPVISDEGDFVGVVFINDVRHVIFQSEMYEKVFVRDLMFMPNEKVSPNDSMEDVAKIFQKTSHYNIPVIEHGKYIGFVSRANVFSAYRKMLRDLSGE